MLKLFPIYDLAKILIAFLVQYLPEGGPGDEITTVLLWIVTLILGGDGAIRLTKKAVKGK